MTFYHFKSDLLIWALFDAYKEFSYIQTYSFEENGYFNGLIIYKK